MEWLYTIPFRINIDTAAIDRGFRSFAVWADPVLRSIRSVLNGLLITISNILGFIPWWVFVLAVFYVGYKQSKKWTTASLYAVLTALLALTGLWALMIQSLAIILASVTISLMLGFPIGVLLSLSEKANRIARPILDTMQTMPIFVYLIPAVLLFGLGRVPAVMATVIYAIVPVIRLTNLGIRQVNPEVVEAAKAFGSTTTQAMIKVQIPQAFATIMAGVNQTLMMAMAMVVTTSMIGASGLGMEVLISVNRIEVGRGLVSGTAVVIVAILLDRLSQGWVKTNASEEEIV